MILGTKVYLRSPEISDLKLFYKWHNDKELKKLAMLNPYYVSLEQEHEWLKNIISDKGNKNITFMIVESSSNIALGYSQLKNINWISRNAWYGIIIGETDKRNMGYGKEATELMINYGFNSLNLNKLQLEVLENNTNAINLYFKLKFSQEGLLKNHFFHDGQYLNVVIMSIIKK